MRNTLTLIYPISILNHLNLTRRFNLRAFWVLGLIFITTPLIFYIIQVNEMTKNSYLISYYEKKIEELSQENKSLEINLWKLNSLENIETLAKNLNFEQVSQVHYIKMLEGTIVTK